MPKVSVIVPCYNQELYIAETLESVLNQTYKEWECIIMDDGSTDNSATVVKQYSDRDKRIRYLEQKNSGVCVARNEAIRYSRGEYILPLDADDIIAPEYIEKAIDVLEHNPDIKLVYSWAEKIGAETGRWYLPEYSFDKLLWNNILFCSAIFRRSDFDNTRGYNSNMVWGCEDWDFWLTFLHPEDKVYLIEEVMFYYRIRQVSRTTESKRNLSNIYRQIVRNHMDLYDNYIDKLIPIRNELYWETIKKESYYRHSLARIKDAIIRFTKR